MDRLENRYEIKRILKSTDEDYIKALAIYHESTPVDIKTDTNEITYWLDKNESPKKIELFVFVLYLDNQIIGFAMLCYSISKKVLIYDYIALKDKYRVNVAYFSYMSLIDSFFLKNGYKINFSVVEISNKNAGKDIDKESRIFHKLLCMEGFGVIDMQYVTLPLGIDDYESSFDAYLYFKKTGDTTSNINNETVRNIVKAIYYDYYETWYSKFLDAGELIEYNKKINSCYKSIEENINSVKTLEVINPECVLPAISKCEPTGGHLPPAELDEHHKKISVIFIVLATIFIPILIVMLYYWILSMFRISVASVSSIVGSAFNAVVSFVIAYLLTMNKKL
jgi:hypothetical protein